MIRYCDLHNFKCFDEQHFAFSKLNILSGLNGAGKSSLIQAMLLLRQSFLETGSLDKLKLNGKLIKLGQGQDVFRVDAEEDVLEISIAIDDWVSQAAYKQVQFADILPRINKASDSDLDVNESMSIKSSVIHSEDAPTDSCNLFSKNFHFLSAERLGPRLLLPFSDYVVKTEQQLGCQGEYAWHFYNEHGTKDIISPTLKHRSSESEKVNMQLVAWMSEICPGVGLDAQDASDIDSVKPRFTFKIGDVSSRDFRPPNVGFGISYAMPVILALLTPFPNSLIIIENPEAHVHPAGQAAIGHLASLAAEAGHQIIIETHSDHILNGIRVSANHKHIKPDHVKLFFFDAPDKKHTPRVHEPCLDADGRIDNWPDGFFDQWDKSLEELL